MSGYLSPGTVFAGRFLVVDRAGEGSSAVVYKVRSMDSSEVLALKLWKGSEFRNENQIQRFQAEAALNQRMSHPNIARVLESGVHEGAVYLVLEYLSGLTLAEYLANSGPVALNEFMATGRDICSAVAHVHGAGVVHRDIKPSNLMYGANGSIKLTDFGIARDRGADLTVGALSGSAGYLSPEQFLGGKASPASDVFSIGVVLFQMLTGRLPFEGMTPAARCGARAPALRPLAPHIPEPLAAAVEACLGNEPDHRPAAEALLAAFTPSAREMPLPQAAAVVPAPPPPPVERIQAPLIRTLAILLRPEPAAAREVVPVFLALVRRLIQIEAAGELHDPITPNTVRLRPDGMPEINSHAAMTVSDSTVVPMARYGAPEVLRAGTPRTAAARTAATVYSMALVLYEILAGTKLFQKEFEAVLAKRSELGWLEWQWNAAAKPTALDKLIPDTPPDLARTVERMLEKDPARRPQSYEEVERVFQRLVLSTQATEQIAIPVPAQATSAARWKPVLAGVGALILTMAALGLALQIFR